MEALLSNEFVVLVLDALLHLASVLVLGVTVVLACKLLSRAHADVKLLTGLMIAVLLVITRIFLLNNIHRVLGGVDIFVIMVAVAFVLFLTSLILVYKIVAIPVIGSALSSIAIVAAQLALAQYTPILSLKLMPEGQRFAEYAGVANERTKQLMNDARALQSQSNGIKEILQRAMASLAFLTSEPEQDNLSKDFSSGIRLYQERKAYMDSLTEDELAEYRAAMSEFLQEQGLAGAGSRYSLSNLKNAKPEDLENLANFMQDMNTVYGFTDEMPVTPEGEEMPPTAESLRQITANLRAMDFEDGKNAELKGLLSNLMESESFTEGLVEARAQLDELRANSGQIFENFSGADLNAMREKLESASGQKSGLGGINMNPEMPSYPKFAHLPDRRDQAVSFSPGARFKTGGGDSFDSRDRADGSLLEVVLFEETGYVPMRYADEDKAKRLGPVTRDGASEAARGSEVAYYLPILGSNGFPDLAEPEVPEKVPAAVVEVQSPIEDESDYYPLSSLSTRLTDGYVLKVPADPKESEAWTQAAGLIHVDAWFEGAGESNRGTILADGIAYRSGEKIERTDRGRIYYFRFEGLINGQVVIRALKRESAKTEAAQGVDE